MDIYLVDTIVCFIDDFPFNKKLLAWVEYML